MIRTASCLVLVVIAVPSIVAFADPIPSSKTIGVDAIGVLPLGDYSDAARFAIGADGRFEYGISNALVATARIGYLYHLGIEDGISLGIIPILVGAKYKIGTSGLFADAEIGASIFLESGMGESVTNTKLGFQVGAGDQIGKIEVKVGLWMPGSADFGNGSESTLYSIMGSVGYDFAL